MWEIRIFEDTIYDLLTRNLIKGTVHLYAGEEAVAVGAIANFRPGDYITSTHRGHGHCLAHGAHLAQSDAERQEHLNKMMAELAGKETGYSRGRGGSMHIADTAQGNLGATGIVAGNIPVATGAGLALKMQKSLAPSPLSPWERGGGEGMGVVLCFFGDGAVNNGIFHESLNMASIWDLPVIYIVENNMYAMSVPWQSVTKNPDAADRAAAYGIPGIVVDGMDVLAVREAVDQAVRRARRGEGPTLVECKTYRWYGHSRSDPRAYRTRDEEKAWKARDPLTVLSQKLLDSGLATQAEIDAVEQTARAGIEHSVKFALEASPNPDPKDLYAGLYAPLKTNALDIEHEKNLRARVRADKTLRHIPYWQAINEALEEEMKRDERVFLMGEDIGIYGGAYGATRGLLEKFGAERVRETPISEAAIAGVGVGAAMAGLRPVNEIMYIDFTLLSADQIANQGAKNRYMFGGKSTVPFVLRTEGGAGRGIAAQHSQSLEAIWTHFPGVMVVMPATPYDAKGLLKAAIREDNLVMFIEHKMLYGEKGPVPEQEYIIPLGVADVKRAGNAVTIISYSRMVLRALDAADILAQAGVDAEVIDLRTLKPLDTETIVESVKKTGRVVIVSEGYKNTGFNAELLATVNDLAFDYLDAPIVRVAAADVPVPASPALEEFAIPQTRDIVAAVRKVME
ncbi:MAG: dehydrogenase E1 component subunit alpha/beta [Chloroflexi bacterium]|nr:dehydrogenase E1 component subunit alpha/beta [Chloroflexota bacterium]